MPHEPSRHFGGLHDQLKVINFYILHSVGTNHAAFPKSGHRGNFGGRMLMKYPILGLLIGILLLSSGCEKTYEAPNLTVAERAKTLFGPEWRRYVNKHGQVAMAFFGQSNAQGQGDSLLSPRLPDSTALEFLYQRTLQQRQGWFKALRDPLSANRPATSKANFGTLVPQCVLTYKEMTGLTPLVVHCAETGSCVVSVPDKPGTWRPGGPMRLLLIEQTEAMLAAAGIERLAWLTMTMGETDGLNSVRWSDQLALFPNGMLVPGAFDAASGYPDGYPNPQNKPDLYSAYTQFFAELRTHFPGVKININQTGTWLGLSEQHRLGVQNIWIMQEHLARTLPDVFCEMRDAKYFESYGYLKDDHVHYNQRGLNYMGRIDGLILASH